MIKNFHVSHFMTPTILWEVNWTHVEFYQISVSLPIRVWCYQEIPNCIFMVGYFSIVHWFHRHLNSVFVWCCEGVAGIQRRQLCLCLLDFSNFTPVCFVFYQIISLCHHFCLNQEKIHGSMDKETRIGRLGIQWKSCLFLQPLGRS